MVIVYAFIFLISHGAVASEWAYNYCAQSDRLHIIISHSLLYNSYNNNYNQQKVTLQSDRIFYWMCSKCPAGQEHAWPASPIPHTNEGVAVPFVLASAHASATPCKHAGPQ